MADKTKTISEETAVTKTLGVLLRSKILKTEQRSKTKNNGGEKILAISSNISRRQGPQITPGSLLPILLFKFAFIILRVYN